ncbi:MAG: diguanylate cyclase [Burkholderiaceae bacterium]|jgi:diguanylate cyclase (GGDEF)-like protein
MTIESQGNFGALATIKTSLESTLEEVRGTNEAVSLVQFNLDGLRHINGIVGFDVGDELLGNFMAILRHRIPEPRLRGRVGADQFVCLLRCTGRDQAI